MTKSRCRQSFTIIVISYSGRASELGVIVNIVDWRRPSLSRSERPPFSSYVGNTFRRSIGLYRGEIFKVRISGKSSRGKHPFFGDIRQIRRKLPCQKPARFVHPFWQNTDLWRTDCRHGQTGRAIASTCACVLRSDARVKLYWITERYDRYGLCWRWYMTIIWYEDWTMMTIMYMEVFSEFQRQTVGGVA